MMDCCLAMWLVRKSMTAHKTSANALIRMYDILVYEAGAVFTAEFIILGNLVPRPVGFGDVGVVPYAMIAVEATFGTASVGLELLQSYVLLSCDELICVSHFGCKPIRQPASQGQSADTKDLTVGEPDEKSGGLAP